MAGEAEPVAAEETDVTRRTWLAAERTWLAWWRTGIAVGAVAIAVGRVVPLITKGARWPFRVLGIAYGVLAIVVLLIGAVRQQRTAEALRRGSYAALSSPLVMWLTAAAIAIAVGSVILVAIRV